MNQILLIPLGGTSSRYPDISRPKWLLNLPNGNLMIQESISKLDTSKFDEIIFVCLTEHYNKYKLDIIFKTIFQNLNYSITVIDSSVSQPDTVCQGLKKYNKDCSFLIKDCDNMFSIYDYTSIVNNNAVCYAKIGIDFNNGDIENKSYITMNDMSQVENIIEKHIISSDFCVGGYAFKSSLEFINAVEKLEHIIDLSTMYVSHVIYHLIKEKKLFNAVRTYDYVDWGTQIEYEKYKKQFNTLFIDIDGVLVQNSAQYFEPYWGTTDALYPNIEYLQNLWSSGKIQIILTTSRTSAYADITKNQLDKFKIPYDQIIFDLWHTKRILINDFAGSNNYRTADAINIERNNAKLKTYLKGVL